MDIATFEKEVLKVERLLYHVSWSMLSQQEDCADAVQEALTRAWQHRDTLRSNRAFRGWLLQILCNVCRDMLRKRKRQPQQPLEDALLATLADEPADYAMIRLLAVLSPEHRTTLVLHYLEGYGVNEIARLLDTPSGTVKSRLVMARRALRDAVENSADLQGGFPYEEN